MHYHKKSRAKKAHNKGRGQGTRLLAALARDSGIDAKRPRKAPKETFIPMSDEEVKAPQEEPIKIEVPEDEKEIDPNDLPF